MVFKAVHEWLQWYVSFPECLRWHSSQRHSTQHPSICLHLDNSAFGFSLMPDIPLVGRHCVIFWLRRNRAIYSGQRLDSLVMIWLELLSTAGGSLSFYSVTRLRYTP